jgi:hypothetical protein
MIFKRIFLSKNFIESRLEYFANSLNLRNTGKVNVASSVAKQEKVEKVKEKEIKVE